MNESRHFLIIVPAMLVDEWEGELRKWIPEIDPVRFCAAKTGDSKEKRFKRLNIARESRAAVILTTYGICRNNAGDLNSWALIR